jgi:hypothetical protein
MRSNGLSGVVACAVLAGVLGAVGGGAAKGQITSDFSADVDGWTTDAGAVATYSSVFGNPAGSLRGVEVGFAAWFFLAPSEFLGDQSAAVNGTLSYDTYTNVVDASTASADVVIEGAGSSLHRRLANPQPVRWVSRSIELSESGAWRVGAANGALATQAQIAAVLADVTALKIRGDFSDGLDVSFIDNVVLELGCAADLSGDGEVDSGDLSLYINAFIGQDLAADLTGDGQVDSGDLSVFISLFITGC